MLGWILVALLVAFIVSTMGIGVATFPFDEYEAKTGAFIKSHCLNENGTDNGKCTVEPLGMAQYLVNGLIKIVSLGASSYVDRFA